jgi:hypothetical protein
MGLSSRLKGLGLIRCFVTLQRVENPCPDISQSSHRDAMALAFGSFALVVVQGPGLTQGGLPGKLLQGIPQGLDTGRAAMCFGIGTALKQDRRGARQRLQAGGTGIAAPIVSNFCQQSRSQTFACPWQVLKTRTVRVSQKKALDLLIVE